MFSGEKIISDVEIGAENGDASVSPDSVSPDEALEPLTAAQRGIWFAQQAAPDGNAFWIAESIDISGDVDAAVFEGALRQVLTEAEGLHAAFTASERGPLQHWRSLSPAWRMEYLDLSKRADPALAAEAWMQADIRQPGGFDGGLFHHALLKVASDRFFFYQRYHHLVADGFSGMLIATRVAALYSRRLDPDATPRRGLRPLGGLAPLLAADKAYETSELQEADRRFWREAMAGWAGPGWWGPPRLGGGPVTEQSLVRPLAVDDALSGQLKAAAAANDVSFADFLIAVVAIWANALSGAGDVALGLALLARPPGAGRAPTTAANVLPVRISVRSGMTAIDLARDAASFRRAARRHWRYRGERLIRELTDGQAASFGPTVNIMSFDYRLRFGPYSGVARSISIGPVEDICVTVHDRQDSGSIQISLNANPAIHEPDQLNRLAARLERLLRAVADNPSAPVDTIDLLDPAERTLLLQTRNQTARDIPFTSLAALFEWQASAAPNAPCLFADDRTETYATVNTGADGLAGHLKAKGVARGDIVAIMLPRSAETLALVLATMKSGGAFLLIDPALPAQRISAMIADAGPKLVGSRTAFSALIPPGRVALMLDDLPPQPPASASKARDILPDDLAYVIFTSGTTGRPKPVGIPHRGLGSLAASLTETLWTEQKSRILQFSSLGFDALVLELCMAFAVGACLYLPREDERYGPPLGRFLDRHGITHALLPPTALAGLRPENQAAPATLIVGGEACSGALAAAWSADRLMVNAYGPAEATVVATMSGKLTGGDAPPIGRPILNTRVYVLDAFGRLAPDGVAGELHVAGDGLAVGYLGQPDLTAQRFLPCPFERQPARMYGTGDLVRWLPNGALEFLGRVDRQIKLRGFRIEPAEIEAALCALPGVAEAYVTPHRRGTELSLAGYVVPSPGAILDAESLRIGLAAGLPSYMAPASITVLPRLPLTPHGKVDAASLPPPAVVQSGRAAPVTAPERMLAPLFAAALGRDEVGAEDNFFALGGDSLKATLLIMRIGEAMDIDLTIAALFRAPSVRALARLIEQRDMEASAAAAVILPLRDGEAPGLFCIHPGPGLGWPYSVLIRHLPETVPIYAVQARGLSDGEELPSSLAQIAGDYAAEIRRLQPAGPYHLLGWSSGGPLAHAVATALQAEGADIGLLASLDGYPSGPGYRSATPSGDDPAADREMLRGTIQRYLAAAGMLDAVPAALLDEAMLTRMLGVFTNTARILSRDALGEFHGDLMLFKSKQAYDVSLPDAESWTPHVTGRIDLVEVDCHHDTMLLPGPIEAIGPIIARRLVSRSRDAAAAGPAPPVDAAAGDSAPAPAVEVRRSPAGPLSILMTNIVLSGRSGTEIMTAELARALHAKGHRVAIYTPEPGPLAVETMARGIPVTNRVDRIGFMPDIIHGHHNVAVAVAMVRFPGAPAVFVCHDSALSFDAPIVCDRIRAYVAIDGACLDRLVVAGVDEARIATIPNGIDLSRFHLREHWAEQPTTALAIVKGDAPHLGSMREACRLEGLALEVVGHHVGRVVDNLQEYCAAADIVLAHSRSAMEAAVTGAAVIICDEYGFGGLLTPREVEDWPNTRLAHRSLDEPLTVPALRAAIRRYRRDDVARFARLLRDRVSLDRIADDYVALYRTVLRDHRDASQPADDGPLAALVAEFLPRLGGFAHRSTLEAAAEQRRRELDDWLALHAPADGADTELAFNIHSLGRLLLDDGWYAAEDWCVWSGDAVAQLRLPAAILDRSGGDLAVRCVYYIPRNSSEDAVKTVEVSARGQRLATWQFTRAESAGNRVNTRLLRIPPASWRGGSSLRLTFRSHPTQSPLEAGDGDDPRQLGFALISIAAGPPAPAEPIDELAPRAVDETVV